MKGLRSILPLPKESLRGITIAEVVGEEPTIEWVDPLELFVEEDYQRDVGANGIARIRKIVTEFSWHKFKLPICFRVPEFDGAIVAVDGQHTSIGAATRGIKRIPVAVYSNATAAERAAAFVAHNRDRVALTMQAIFKADLAAGDATAAAAHRACEAAGAKVLTHPINLNSQRPVGETMAVGTLRAIIKRAGPEHLTRVMKVLVAAGRGPIKAQEITAASTILLSPKKVPDVDERLAAIVRSRSAKAWSSKAIAEPGTLPQALAALWTRELDKPAEPRDEAVARPAGWVKPPDDKLKADSVKQIPESDKPVAEPAKAERPVDNYRAPPPKKAVTLAHANGIAVDAAGRLARDGWRPVEVGEKGAMLVARLVTVMPAQIGHDRLAEKIFSGKPSARLLLADLVAAVNAELRRAGLEIFEVKSSGYMLRDARDIAKSGDNLLRA